MKAASSHPLSFFQEHEEIILGKKEKDYGINRYTALSDHPSLYHFSDDVYETNDVKSLIHLVTNHESWDVSSLIYKAFITIFFIRCLQSANYFGHHQSAPGESLTCQEVLVGRLMSDVMEVASMNSHEIGVAQCVSGKDHS